MKCMREKINKLWYEELKQNSYDISDDDFSVLDHYISGKRIILLGENSHGISDYFTIKNKIIKYLHKKHDFNIVVLENSFFESFICNAFLKDDPPIKKIQNCLLDIYHHEKMNPLFAEDWANEIQIFGMDPQPTYSYGSNYLVEWLKDNFGEKLYSQISKAEKQFFEIDRDIMDGRRGSRSGIKRLVYEYQHLIIVLEEIKKSVKDDQGNEMFLFLLRGMENRINWLKLNLKGAIISGIKRGYYMYQNLKWIMEKYNDNSKIIVWTHNFHIRKSQTFITKTLGIKSVGYWLNKNYCDQFYSIGFYAGSGTFSTQLRVQLSIQLPHERHLESFLNRITNKSIFLPINGKETKKNWFKKRWMLLESSFMGLSSVVLKPKKHYDAIIFMKHVNAPEYYSRKS
ncbi:erythromycin esterase family protein [Gracilibacillus sp. HCP3S3_G5_1]|uniref:erythromycin esterase family protein n=1 Tax=unclassified Gracilibacillus TaxID=2625209 RepID=UPI003F8B0C49